MSPRIHLYSKTMQISGMFSAKLLNVCTTMAGVSVSNFLFFILLFSCFRLLFLEFWFRKILSPGKHVIVEFVKNHVSETTAENHIGQAFYNENFIIQSKCFIYPWQKRSQSHLTLLGVFLFVGGESFWKLFRILYRLLYNAGSGSSAL